MSAPSRSASRRLLDARTEPPAPPRPPWPSRKLEGHLASCPGGNRWEDVDELDALRKRRGG
ncbi:MAG: hypothetical protein IPJ61_21745 [Tessaracoccus sp.]|uniref:hypothetical protein n=1 Tax=Tessaracoccus sp. TaxID=1971211 RepID=UPI001ED4A40C|nr:hypothetical protein [Tessaracoccus sp.]MBK7823614.1 hypothetical protein [Tessaracoccus sp.]